MLYIKMKNNLTGEVKDIKKNLEWYGDFVWSEGNFACDCNRAIFFNNDDIECSGHIYTIISIKDENDNLLYKEGK